MARKKLQREPNAAQAARAGASRGDSGPASPTRTDGWQNLLTGVGDPAWDKRTAGFHCATLTDRATQEDLWRGNDLAARAVEKIPHEMMREGFDLVLPDAEADDEKNVRSDAVGGRRPDARFRRRLRQLHRQYLGNGVYRGPRDPSRADAASDAHDVADALMQQWRDLDGHAIFLRAQEYERAYGGSVIILGVNDGTDPKDLHQPLNLASVKSIDWLNVLTPREMYAIQYYSDPRAADYGKPSVFRVMPEMLAGPSAVSGDWAGTGGSSGAANPTTQIFEVHESRVLIFPGIVTSPIARRMQAGWGDSVFNRAYPVLRDFGISWDAAAALLSDFAQGVFKIKGLAELIASGGEEVVKKRLQLLDQSRSFIRSFLIDAEEDFTREATPLSGLPELLEKFMLRLAAAFEMPVSLLMGQAPAGLNATGDSDIRWFYDQIAARQEHVLKPRLERLFKIMMNATRGPTGGVEPDTWQIRFRPLWQLSESEEATRRLAMAQADVAYVNAGVLAPEEVAESRFGGDAYSVETVVDMEARAEMAAAEPDPVPPGAAPPTDGSTLPGAPPQAAEGSPAPVEAPPAKPQPSAPGRIVVAGHERTAPKKRTPQQDQLDAALRQLRQDHPEMDITDEEIARAVDAVG